MPLAVGCLMVPLLFFIRRSLSETPAFLVRAHRPTIGLVLRSLAVNWRVVLVGVLLVTMTTVSFYMITAYTPTFGKDVLHLTSRDSLIVTACVGVSNFVWLPVMGALSDKVGRRPLLLACTILVLLTAWPSLAWLTAQPSFARLLGVELWLSFLYASYNGAMVVYLTEIMPAEVRTSGFSLAYSLATALFGGFTPAVSTWLIHITKNPAMPAAWLCFAAACGLGATLAAGKMPREAAELQP